MSAVPVRAVLWDADGVVQDTPVRSWELAVRVVRQFPDALTGGAFDAASIRAAAHDLGLTQHVEEILSVWSTFRPWADVLEIVASVRAAGTPCYLATNQDALRAQGMRATTDYDELFDGSYYSCEIGAMKPSATFFEVVVADLGLAAHEVLLLDDTDGNVVGARSASLRAQRWTHDDGVDRLCEILTDSTRRSI